MKRLILTATAISVFFAAASCGDYEQRRSRLTGEMLMYHEIRVDGDGGIVPWFSDDPAEAYDDVIGRIWNFWDTMKVDYNGLPYYMNHLAWCPEGYIDRGIGGDQVAMMLSSWQLLYAYSGNQKVKENMQFMTDWYLSHSLSPSDCRWPDLPFPQNTVIYSGIYDGDMILGPGYLQPDKAGSFGLELLKMHRFTTREPQRGIYLEAAVKIANTLARNVRKGDADHSPWPFKVNAFTGETGQLRTEDYHVSLGESSYTSNYAPTLELMTGLCEMGAGRTEDYRRTIEVVKAWMDEYPVRLNRWGPFFEDVPGWSDTQINAVTWAQFLMAHPEMDQDWQSKVRGILDWVYEALGNDSWAAYGVTAINEQTFYKVPGNSHTARQACAELQYASLTGDMSRYGQAVRQLNWATYMVSEQGWNRYPQDDIWITDGYGDYVRHYLRAMAACPGLAPAGIHILSSTCALKKVEIQGNGFLCYVPDSAGEELIRLPSKPVGISFGWEEDSAEAVEGQDWDWKELGNGGVVTLRRSDSRDVCVNL